MACKASASITKWENEMKKYYCDKCGSEVTHDNRFKNVDVKVEGVAFHVSIEDAIPCEYDICKYCVLSAINSLDDRPTCG